ncbi:MAG: glycosyltransferase [Nitrospirae bacterium]|nr:glycosyltransferase [Nitrospirota bacterium]
MGEGRKLRILHVTQRLLMGGAEKVTVDIVSNLDRARFRPCVWVFEDGDRDAECRSMGIPFDVVKRSGLPSLLFIIKLARMMARHGIDVVHCHGVAATVHAGLAARLALKPVIVTVHGRSAFGVRSGVWGLKLIKSVGGKVVAVSEPLRQELASECGLDESAILTIHNGINPEEYVVSGERSAVIRREMNLDGCMVIGTVGNLRNEKGQRFLIDAMPEIVRRFPDARLLIVGADGTGILGELTGLVERLGMSRHVNFLGQRHDIPELLALFDIVVQPSLTEGISIAILEAMAAGRPIVATNVGGNPTLIRDGESGILVPPSDSSRLAKAVSALVADPAGRDSMARAASQRVRNEFSIGACVSGYERLYMEKAGA